MSSSPTFIRREEDIDDLIWNNLCYVNLAKYIVPPITEFIENENVELKVGIVSKGCVGRTIIHLAKENKVTKGEKDSYRLDITNLDSEIGSHAGRVWKILDIWGESDFVTLKRLSDLQDNQVHSALGWLAREDKIIFGEKQKFTLK